MAISNRMTAHAKVAPDTRCEVTPEMGRLLGSRGVKVLEKAVRCLESVIQAHDWPRPTLTLRLETDLEIPDWECVIIRFAFPVSEEIAEEYLEPLYPDIDVFAGLLTPAYREVFDRLIWFDVATA